MGKDVELVILFADVVGSTQLYEKLGDLTARDMVGRCLEIMKEATEQHGGTVIKTMGDEVMSTFPTADAAMNAAQQMQQRISLDDALAVAGGGHVAIRIGCHFGPVVQESRDVFGSAVHTANRMTSQAKAKQIITTASTVEQLSPNWRADVRQIDLAAVRGQTDEVALFEVLWQPDDATSMLPTISWGDEEQQNAAKLTLTFQSQSVVLGPGGRRNATLGRAEDNDLVVKGNLISRLHARVETRRNKFFLVDESTNGTFLQTLGGEEIFVRRDTTQLNGEGVIGLGHVSQPGTALAVHYVVEE